MKEKKKKIFDTLEYVNERFVSTYEHKHMNGEAIGLGWKKFSHTYISLSVKNVWKKNKCE